MQVTGSGLAGEIQGWRWALWGMQLPRNLGVRRARGPQLVLQRPYWEPTQSGHSLFVTGHAFDLGITAESPY